MLALAQTSCFCSHQAPPRRETGAAAAASKSQTFAGAQCFLDFISVKDVEVLESTQRAPENAGRAGKSVT